MNKLPLDDLLAFSRRTVLVSINRALAAGRPLLALDGTAGNGVDTEFLARAAGETGRVLAFDVQAEALARTARRLSAAGLDGTVRLIHDGHEHLADYLEPGRQINAAMYNLGFLPGGPAAGPVTDAATTLASLRQLTGLIAPGGIVSVHCYTGQAGGAAEAEAVRGWAESLPWADWRVLGYGFCNKAANREYLYLACRLSAD